MLRLITLSFLVLLITSPIQVIQAAQNLSAAQLQMISNQVVVKPDDGDNKTAGGLIIPDTSKEKALQGTVIAVGPGKKNDMGDRVALDVVSGDRVLFGSYSGTEIKLDGADHLIMRESDILAIIK